MAGELSLELVGFVLAFVVAEFVVAGFAVVGHLFVVVELVVEVWVAGVELVVVLFELQHVGHWEAE